MTNNKQSPSRKTEAARNAGQTPLLVDTASTAPLAPEPKHFCAPPTPHQHTVREAKDEWRSEGNPN